MTRSATSNRHAVRDLNQWIPDLVPYFDGIEFRVVELDEISPNDVDSETLRPRNQLGGWNRYVITKGDDDRTLRGALLVDVDDGTYAVQVSVTMDAGSLTTKPRPRLLPFVLLL